MARPRLPPPLLALLLALALGRAAGQEAAPLPGPASLPPGGGAAPPPLAEAPTAALPDDVSLLGPEPEVTASSEGLQLDIDALYVEEESNSSVPEEGFDPYAFQDAGASEVDPYAVGPGGAAGQQQESDPLKRVGKLVSLLEPSPGAAPQLTPAQQEAAAQLGKLRQGVATVTYDREVGALDAQKWACGIGFLNPHFQEHFVALPKGLFGQGEPCGACVRMWCVDAACEGALERNELFMVADSCNDCKPTGNDLVAAFPGLGNLTGLNMDLTPSVRVAWAFTSCAPLIEGGIRMLPAATLSPEFVGLQFSNLKSLLRSVTLSGLAMQRKPYGYWELSTPGQPLPLRPPYELQLVSVRGERLAARLGSLRPQDLGVNFEQA